MDDDEALKLISKAIDDSKYRWRTPSGLSRDSGLSIDKVTELLEGSGAFVRARRANARGEALFAIKEKISKESTFKVRLLSALTNKVQE